jgi:hypothetical protein
MTSGAKVVVAMFGAVGAIALLAVIAFLLMDDQAVRCVEGELQDNAVRADGSVIPRVETFESLEEAEAFICRRIPHPRETGDFTLSAVRVARERNLGDTIEGEGSADVELDYAALPDGATFNFGVSFPPEPVEGDPADHIEIGGSEAVLKQNEDLASVQWNRDGWTIYVPAQLTANFEAADLMEILESVR